MCHFEIFFPGYKCHLFHVGSFYPIQSQPRFTNHNNPFRQVLLSPFYRPGTKAGEVKGSPSVTRPFPLTLHNCIHGHIPGARPSPPDPGRGQDHSHGRQSCLWRSQKDGPHSLGAEKRIMVKRRCRE